MWPTTRSLLRYRPALEALESRLAPAGTLSGPGFVGISAIDPSHAKVTWNEVGGETGYRVMWWNGTQAVTLATVGAGVDSATVGSLPGGQLAWICVEAFNATTYAVSTWASVQMPADPLMAPAGVVAKGVSTTEIDISWTRALHATSYKLLEWDGTTSTVVATLSAAAHKYAATALKPGTVYYFSIQTLNGTSTSQTKWVSATTLRQAITAPTHVAAGAVADTQITLTWHAAHGATGYRVFEWENNQAVQVGQSATTQLTVTGLTAGTGYWFYVQAYNDSNSAVSAWKFFATTAISNPLQPPANLTAKVVASGTVELDWTPSTGAAGYWVYLWTGATWKIVAKPNATAQSVQISGLGKGQVHYFVVTAYTANDIQTAASPIVSILV
jgi:hypothetical protein